jgi:hypothetical protein
MPMYESMIADFNSKAENESGWARSETGPCDF